MKEPYVTTQICVLKTDRKLVAFYDKLRYSPATSYAQIHANGEYTENNRKVRSLIGLHVRPRHPWFHLRRQPGGLRGGPVYAHPAG